MVSSNGPGVLERLEPFAHSPGTAMQYAEHPAVPASHTLDDAARLARQRHSRRANFVKWLRRVHGWMGLWGAAFGLMFGVTGILLNHRGPPLQIATGEPRSQVLQVPVAQPAPRSPKDLAQRLGRELHLSGKLGRVRREPAQPVAWGERSVMQPEHWTGSFVGPRASTSFDYWVGNGFVSVKHNDHALLNVFNNLHRSVGMSLAWVLLMDTVAGGMILLALTGVTLWTQLHRNRTLAVVLVGGSITVAALCAWL